MVVLSGGGIPNEIIEFLKSPGGHSLVIKGEAGSGKTTFALQLIEALEGEQPEYYLSSRVSDEALFKQFPWLREKVRRQDVLKAGKAFLRAKGCSEEGSEREQEERVRVAKRFLKTVEESSEDPVVMRTELKRLEGLIEAGEVDMEDGEVDIEGDDWTMNLGVLLPELELAYDIAEMNLPRKTLVVLDSIEGLSERYGISPKRILNLLQKDLVENSCTNVVYILETSEKTELDYLGDGVVVVSNQERDGRKIRQMRIEKLRGARIERWKYNFTLDQGRFRAISPIEYPSPRALHTPGGIADPSEWSVSSGIVGYDALFGGLPKGELTLVEVGIGVQPDIVGYLEGIMMANAMAQGRGVAWFPGSSIDYHAYKDELTDLLGADALRNLVVLDTEGITDLDLEFLMNVEGTDAAQDLGWDGLDYRLQGREPPYLSIIGFDRLEAVYGPNAMSQTILHMDGIKRKGHVGVAIASSNCTSLPALSHRATRHLRVENLAGVPVISGKKPYTPFYFLELNGPGALRLQMLV